jgi:hypothetical protein
LRAGGTQGGVQAVLQQEQLEIAAGTVQPSTGGKRV